MKVAYGERRTSLLISKPKPLSPKASDKSVRPTPRQHRQDKWLLCCDLQAGEGC